MKTILSGAAMAGAAMLSCAQARASTIVQCPSSPTGCQLNLNDSDPTSPFSGSLSSSAVSAVPFTDIYSFNLGSGVASFTFTSSSTGATDDIDFSSVQLSGPDGVLAVPQIIGDPSELFQLNNFAVSAGLYTLTLIGAAGTPNAFVGGAYSGNLSFTPSTAVPEPATWAFLIGGFGLVGASMRRSRRMKTISA